MTDTIAFDFDGVITNWPEYRWPVTDGDVGPVRHALDRGYSVAVVTANDVKRVAGWLRKQGIDAVADPRMLQTWWDGGRGGKRVLVTNRKIHYSILVDDRAVLWHFGGDQQAIFAAEETAWARRRRMTNSG